MRNDFLKKAVIYQISLRSFTRDGTFQAAKKMLPHVKIAGADVVYLCPFMTMDRDMDRSGWSKRQIKAGFETPKNPYRISDYTKVDPEYGTDQDAKDFTDCAHALGMKVVFDLVYLHCGPNNVIQNVIPDAFQKNPDGTTKLTVWNFPYINFESKAVREYLYENMRYLAEDIGCDGFRCDVGDEVPLDFWAEGFRRMRAIKSDFIAINEGRKLDYLTVFDANYNWPWSFGMRCLACGSGKIADLISEQVTYEKKCPEPPLDLLFMENHDISTDDWEKRIDRIHPVEVGNALFTAHFLRSGTPVLYCGNEIADNALMTFFGPVEDPRRAYKTVDWARALQPEGQKRLAHIRRLSELRHTVPVFAEGSMEYVMTSAPDKILAFARATPDGTRALVLINLSNEEVRFTLDETVGKEVLFSDGVKPGTTWTASPFGIFASLKK